MTKKMNLATALHKAPHRRRKEESSSETIETAGKTRTEVTAAAAQNEVPSAAATPFDFIPAIGQALSKAVYTPFYYASFGIVFAVVKIARWIPTDNVMGHGMHDGAVAAKADFQQSQANGPLAQANASGHRGSPSNGEHLATA